MSHRISSILCAICLIVTGFVSFASALDQEPTKKKTKKPKAKVQIAILLDTSGSMSGLIHQARTQLWKIVNDFEHCRKNGRRPELEVALYEYGKSSLPVTEHYLQQIVPFTSDLDLLSEKLFELTTNGGQEYCGAVIQDAVNNLEWSTRKADLKMIFIAGNEPFSQGPIDFRPVCGEAIAQGITVNTIHCGSETDGKRGYWAEGAALGEGSFLNIDHNDIRPTPATPYDKRLIELSLELNTTYVLYGEKKKRLAFQKRQLAQDANAAEAAPSIAAGRAATKGSSFYDNSGFDLIDALETDKLKLNSLKEEELPEELRKLTRQERDAYLAKKKTERENIRVEIKKLNKQRADHLEKLSQEEGESESQFEDAVLNTVRDQAESRSFNYIKAD